MNIMSGYENNKYIQRLQGRCVYLINVCID